MFDTFFSNRKEDIDQLIYLLKHKYRIYKAGRQLDVPRFQLLKHDITKFKPRIWKAYREYWFDKPTKKDRELFRQASNIHKAQERHHHPNRTLPYQLESVADWYSVGKKRPEDFKTWVKKNIHTFPLPASSKKIILEKIAMDNNVIVPGAIGATAGAGGAYLLTKHRAAIQATALAQLARKKQLIKDIMAGAVITKGRAIPRRLSNLGYGLAATGQELTSKIPDKINDLITKILNI